MLYTIDIYVFKLFAFLVYRRRLFVRKIIFFSKFVVFWSKMGKNKFAENTMSAQGPGRLYIVIGVMRQVKYIQMLQARLLLQMVAWFPHGGGIYMQDGAPCHTVKAVIEFLRQENIPLLS